MKYKLTEETKIIGGVTLYRIQALKDFADVEAGDLGGWIEKEGNLSQDGGCWVFDDAWVCDDAEEFSRKNWIVIDGIGSEDGTLTAFTQKDNSIGINRGCYSGTIDEFEKRVKETHGDNIHAQIYLAEGLDRRSPEYKAAVKEYGADFVLVGSEVETVNRMVESARMNTDFVDYMRSPGHSEVSMFAKCDVT